jgi:hypothetical protein
VAIDPSTLPARVSAAADALAGIPERVDAAAARLVLDAALPRTPRARGWLANTGRVDTTGAAVSVEFGGGRVDYAAAVHAANPWMASAAAYTEAAAGNLNAAAVDDEADHLS